jgi:hypothetical protein
MLLVHYADLKRDRGAEMRHVADFLGIEIAESLWPELIEAAGFDAMKRQGDALIPEAKHLWGEDGANRFFNRGKNGRWKDVVRMADLDRYGAKVREAFSPDLADWIEHGRSPAGRSDSGPRQVQPSMPTADAHSGLR